MGMASIKVILVLLFASLTACEPDNSARNPVVADNFSTALSPFTALVVADQRLALPVLAVRPHSIGEEAGWSRALAKAIGAREEFRTPFGRVDLLTPTHAVEVDWLRKWHEALGQALHYAHATGRKPAFVLILKPEQWPLSQHYRGKLGLIRDVARNNGVQAFVVIQAPPPTAVASRS